MIVDDLAAALTGGDVTALGSMLHPDVVLVSDGGGKVVTPLRPVRGAPAVAGLVAALVTADSVVAVESVNGRAGLVVRRAGRACAVIVALFEGSVVTHAWVVLNPDKIDRWDSPG